MLSCFSNVLLFVMPWTVAHQAPLSMGFSRQEYWNGWPFPSLGDFPNPGINLASLRSPALAGGFFTTRPLGKPKTRIIYSQIKSWFLFFVMLPSLGHFLLSSEYFTLRNLQCSIYAGHIFSKENEKKRERAIQDIEIQGQITE